MINAGIIIAIAACFISAVATVIMPRVDPDPNQGQPISVGLAANRTLAAASVFGTTSDSFNFLTLPTALCIVPMYNDEAGMGKEHKVLTVQQALEICPRAQCIVVGQTISRTAPEEITDQSRLCL
ncbi:hypothetical protein FRC12_001150 [Ceratobasidium sp. 428]|nr:hypothetical protein FRC12_001150 [Ceratobasidium sp. 428]